MASKNIFVILKSSIKRKRQRLAHRTQQLKLKFKRTVNEK